MVKVSHQPPHLLQSLGLHEDVVLGKEQGGNLREFPDGWAVGIGDDGPEAVQGIVQVVHPPPLSGVDAQPQGPRLLGLLAAELAPVGVVLALLVAVLVVPGLLVAAVPGVGVEVEGRRRCVIARRIRTAEGAVEGMPVALCQGQVGVGGD